MTGIALGLAEIENIALGNTPIVKVSLGDVDVWPAAGPPGETEYVIITASVSFIVPAGVTRMGVCMVGSGGNGANRTTAQGQVGGGGGGGGLAWASFDVTPGEEFTFSLGLGVVSNMSTAADGVLMRGGVGSNAGGGTATNGGSGGTGAITANGVSFFAARNGVTGVGAGGAGGNGSTSVGPTAGGGGAGGYGGAGGVGASSNVTLNGTDGAGGAGGGGACNTTGDPRRGSRGGDVVLLGAGGSGVGGVGGASPTDGGWGSFDGVPTTEQVPFGGSGGGAGFNQTIGINGTSGAIAVRLNGPDYPTYVPALTDSTTFLPPLAAGQMPSVPEQPEQPIVPEDLL